MINTDILGSLCSDKVKYLPKDSAQLMKAQAATDVHLEGFKTDQLRTWTGLAPGSRSKA